MAPQAKGTRTGHWHWVVLWCVLIASVVIAVLAGKYPLTWSELLAALYSPFRGG